MHTVVRPPVECICVAMGIRDGDLLLAITVHGTMPIDTQIMKPTVACMAITHLFHKRPNNDITEPPCSVFDFGSVVLVGSSGVL